MNLLPSDPMYEAVMADQTEESESTILADAFRSRIYNLFAYDPWSIDPDNLYDESMNDYYYDNLTADKRYNYTVQPQNYTINGINYPDSLRTTPYNDSYGWGNGDGTWIDPHR